MIDFHSHILPGLDDGAKDLETSLKMLKISKDQNVDIIFATPHFYADRQYPDEFLKDRAESYDKLLPYLKRYDGLVPEVRLGCEVFCYPGMSETEELKMMNLQGTDILMLEPPMETWSDYLLDEMVETGKNTGLRICCAHVDRYMRVLKDESLINRLIDRDILIQFNTKAFVDINYEEKGFEYISLDMVDMIGTDAHNLTGRTPNMLYAAKAVIRSGQKDSLERYIKKSYSLLTKKD